MNKPEVEGKVETKGENGHERRDSILKMSENLDTATDHGRHFYRHGLVFVA